MSQQVGDEDVAGLGHFHCDVCCRHFQSEDILKEHVKKSKDHKKQVKRIRIETEAEEKDQMRANKRIRRSSHEVEMASVSTNQDDNLETVESSNV